jgi:two-component system nitrogen regulation sensor histidine kinase NtrY
MGRLELKLLALLVLLTGVPLGVAFWLSGPLFERSLGAGLNPTIARALEDAVDVYGDYVRVEKARQEAVARGLADSRTLAEAAREGPAALERTLRRYAEAPRVFSVALEPAAGSTMPAVEAATPRDGAWLRRTVEVPLEGVPGYARLRYTFGLERAFLERFERMESEVIRPFGALTADRERVADVFAWSFIGYLAGALFLAAGVSVYVGRRVTRRLHHLRAAMEAVAAGELDARVEPAGRDEVADLARDFNQMAERLGAFHHRVQYLTQVSAWQGIARKLAHEIKNPLTPILLSVQQVHRSYKGDDARFRRTLDTAHEVVEQEVGTLKRLVENFSRFARLPTVTLAPEDLVAIARELAAAHPEIDGLEVVAPDAPLPLDLDRGLLRQALTNLLKNAHEALRGAEDPPRVVLRVEPTREGGGRVVVEDNGPGVAAERRAEVFEPYVTDKHDGTGLGLAIVKRIVVEHGGTITLGASELGGARFEISLPPPG